MSKDNENQSLTKSLTSHPFLTLILVILGSYIIYQIGSAGSGSVEPEITLASVNVKSEKKIISAPITIAPKPVTLESKILAIAITKIALEPKTVAIAQKSGEQLFSSFGCAGCHGAGGKSTVPMFPVLAGKDADYLVKQLNDFQSGVRPSPMMIGQAVKTKGYERVIADYLASQK